MGKVIKKYSIETPLGVMQLIGDDQFLYAAEFVGGRSYQVEQKLQQHGYQVVDGSSVMIELAKKEMLEYFTGGTQQFTIPLYFIGTEFQKKSWSALNEIPFGITKSYQEQACAVGNEKAFRAVANANSKNYFAIIVPCHRVINKNGKLGGYGGGLDRKQWLLKHERAFYQLGTHAGASAERVGVDSSSDSSLLPPELAVSSCASGIQLSDPIDSAL